MEAIFAHENPSIKCSHCGGVLTGGWEGSCNRGSISLEYSSLALNALFGEGYNDFDHPVMTPNNTHQHIELSWNSQGKYRICRKCQRELMKTIGDFFKVDKCYTKDLT
jgi:hypothetical protein